MKFYVYGREVCPNCTTAKTMLHRSKKNTGKVDYEYLDYDDHKNALEAKHGTLPRSLPIIVADDQIVLYQNLAKMIKEIEKGTDAQI